MTSICNEAPQPLHTQLTHKYQILLFLKSLPKDSHSQAALHVPDTTRIKFFSPSTYNTKRIADRKKGLSCSRNHSREEICSEILNNTDAEFHQPGKL